MAHRCGPWVLAVGTCRGQWVLERVNPDAVKYLAPEYYQHNPTIPNGSAGLRELFTHFFRQFPNLTVERKRVIAERDYVAIHAHYRLNPEDRGQAEDHRALGRPAGGPGHLRQRQHHVLTVSDLASPSVARCRPATGHGPD